jgi:hypothetical protein
VKPAVVRTLPDRLGVRVFVSSTESVAPTQFIALYSGRLLDLNMV